MSYDNTSPEPKQYFLDLLIKLNFYVADAVYRYHNYHEAIDGMNEIVSLTCIDDQSELKEMAAKLKEYASSQNAPIDEIPVMFTTIQKYLMKHWFSELNLGTVIPTSTLPTDTKKPSHAAISSNQSSRL